MTSKFLPAKETGRPRIANGLWLDHAIISEQDIAWLEPIERLTLWNVKLPKGFLAKLPRLWWLDIRGGSADDLSLLQGAWGLKYLAMNQVPGLADLSTLESFTNLRLLSLYGLAKVVQLPSLRDLINLERAEIGQMRSLETIRPVLDAPNLKELYLLRKLNVSSDDAHAISEHSRLERFHWSAEDVPNRIWGPVVESIQLPKTRAMHPEEWFGLEGGALQAVSGEGPASGGSAS